MCLRLILLTTVPWAYGLPAQSLMPRAAPSYSQASTVNAADNLAGPLAPNAIATVYGVGLSYITKGIATSDIFGGLLPTVLPGTGVHVLVGGIPAGIYFVSPGQINFLVPGIIIPGASDVRVTLDGVAGPDVAIQIAPSSPGMFQLDGHTLIATRPDGSLVTSDQPARRGDVVILYGTGLGAVNPPLANLAIPAGAAVLKQPSDFTLLADGTPLDPGLVLYAGVAPGFAGLYQINFKLPDSIGPNPEIRVLLGGLTSPAGFVIPVQP